MFITTDEEDEDDDDAADFKYGLAHNHRLLGAITEVRIVFGMGYDAPMPE